MTTAVLVSTPVARAHAPGGEEVQGLTARIEELAAHPLGSDAKRMRGAPGPWSERHGLCLSLRSHLGRIGQGEASPLPGLSPDTLAECREELRSFPWATTRVGTVADVEQVCTRIRAPAARFAAETALLSLLAAHGDGTVAELLTVFVGRPLHRAVELCALVTDPLDLARTAAEVAAAWARGLRSIKIKIGRPGRFEGELAVVERLRSRYGPALSIRLDVNRGWSRTDAEQNLARLASVAPEYVEEPCVDWLGLDSAVPLAADELLVGAAPRVVDRILAHPQVRALVLKPMVLGGALPCLRLAERARAHGLEAVASHTFDGPIALRACVDLALVLGGTAGLDRHPGLDQWPRASIPSLRTDRIEHAAPDPAQRLSIHDVAERLGDAPFLLFGERTITYREMSSLVRAHEEELGPAARSVIVADRSLGTVTRILGALAARIPALLLHHRSTEEQRRHWLALAEQLPRRSGIDVVLFTSGSSGSPKGVLIEGRALMASADASATHLGSFEDDRWLCCLPLAHISGLSILSRTLLAGSSAVLMPEGSFDPQALAEAVASQRVTLLSLVPTMLARLLEIGWSPPAHLRAILVGGARLPGPMLERARNAGLPVLATYGMTETCSQIATQDPGPTGSPPRAGHIGPPLPGVQIDVRQGRVWVRTPALCRGYLVEDPDEGRRARARFDAEGFFDTGDLGWLDDAGHLHIRGRADDTIITGSENVDPVAVERILCSFPGIVAACVLGLPDPVWGQLVAAAVVSEDDRPLDTERLVAFLREQLPTHQRPRRLCRLPWLVPEGRLKVARAEVEERARGQWQPLSYRRAE